MSGLGLAGPERELARLSATVCYCFFLWVTWTWTSYVGEGGRILGRLALVCPWCC